MACSIPGTDDGLYGHPPTAIKMFLAVTVDVSPVAVVCTLTEFGPASDPVASMTSTPAFFSTKFWYTLLRRVISLFVLCVCMIICLFVFGVLEKKERKEWN